ncbi:hypothetical protein ScPMuIL_000914 [Solemya velum]
MPPKKKKSAKKSKKSGKKSAGGSRSKSSIGVLNELSKEYYLIQITDLENRLARYQKKCDELEVSNGQFHDKFDQMASDKKEIVAFWKRQVEQKSDEIADLNDRLIGLQQAKDAEKESYETQLGQMSTEFRDRTDHLQSENMILGGKLASLEEFKVQKEDLMAKFQHMEEELELKEKDHKEVIYGLEKKNVIDKDRLKKDMVLKVNQVAAEFRKVSNKQMAETTKRTIRENVSINAQLAKMSDKTLEMIQENDDLREREKKQKQQVEMLEANEKEMAKKNHSNQRIIKMLTEKCRNQEAIIVEFEMREQEFEELEEQLQLLQQQMTTQNDEIVELQNQNEQLNNKFKATSQQLVVEKKHKQKLDQVLIDASSALRIVLRKSSPEEEEDELNEIERRDNMLENLLVILNSAASLGIGPSPGELGKQFHVRQRSASEIPGKGRGIKKGQLPMSPMAADESGTLPHYQLGDLGLIPRPKHQIPTNMDKMRVLSATTRLGGLRRVLTRSVGIQTVSAPKAMFYADQLLSRAPLVTQEAVLKDFQSDRSRSPMILGPIVSAKKMGRVH